MTRYHEPDIRELKQYYYEPDGQSLRDINPQVVRSR